MSRHKRRLERLENRLGPLESPNAGEHEKIRRAQEREARLAELRHLHEAVREKAELEAEEGFPQRMRALVELEGWVKARKEAEGGG